MRQTLNDPVMLCAICDGGWVTVALKVPSMVSPTAPSLVTTTSSAPLLDQAAPPASVYVAVPLVNVPVPVPVKSSTSSASP